MNSVELKQEIDGITELLKKWSSDGRSHPARSVMEEDLEELKKKYAEHQSAVVVDVETGIKTPYLEYIGNNQS